MSRLRCWRSWASAPSRRCARPSAEALAEAVMHAIRDAHHGPGLADRYLPPGRVRRHRADGRLGLAQPDWPSSVADPAGRRAARRRTWPRPSARCNPGGWMWPRGSSRRPGVKDPQQGAAHLSRPCAPVCKGAFRMIQSIDETQMSQAQPRHKIWPVRRAVCARDADAGAGSSWKRPTARCRPIRLFKAELATCCTPTWAGPPR